MSFFFAGRKGGFLWRHVNLIAKFVFALIIVCCYVLFVYGKSKSWEIARVYAKVLHGFISWENFFPGDSKFCAAFEKNLWQFGEKFFVHFLLFVPGQQSRTEIT